MEFLLEDLESYWTSSLKITSFQTLAAPKGNDWGNVNLKMKTAGYLTGKNEFIQEWRRIAIWDKQATAKPQAAPAKKREKHYFTEEEEEEVGRGVLSRSLLERC